MAYNVIDPTTPARSDKKKYGADQIRGLKQAVIDCLKEICGYPSVSTIITKGWTTDGRPTDGLVEGLTGYNSDDDSFERYNGTAFVKAGKRTGLVPQGGIIMWNGSAADIANIDSLCGTYALCDGSIVNGVQTPDLRSKFIVGAGSDYEPGATGGEASVTLTENEMPIHHHDTSYSTSTEAGAGLAFCESPNGLVTRDKIAISNAGGGKAHENRPPFYALCFIIRVA